MTPISLRRELPTIDASTGRRLVQITVDSDRLVMENPCHARVAVRLIAGARKWRACMEALFARIKAAAPTPLRLSEDELLALETWLNTHRRRISYAEMREAAKGDARTKAKLDSERSWHEHLQFVAQYNRARCSTDTGKRPKRGSGRPAINIEMAREREQLITKWNRAKESGVRQKDFCGDNGISVKELDKIINWSTQQRRRNRAST